jgi:transposase
VSLGQCQQCAALAAALEEARGRARMLEARVRTLEARVDELGRQLREAGKLIELQNADLERYRQSSASVQPNRSERAALNPIQLAFVRVLEQSRERPSESCAESASESPPESNAPNPDLKLKPPQGKPKGEKKRHPHGRRRLDLTNLPVERVEIEPEEVLAAGRKGFVRIGEETSERVAYRPGEYFRLQLVRGKWVRIQDLIQEAPIPNPVATDASAEEQKDAPQDERSPVIVAPLPESVWPKGMADPSAVADVIISKYDDCMPLHRQERISARHGFRVPRSTQSAWLGMAYSFCHHIVEAMLAEARAKAFCIATDATGVPVRNPFEKKDDKTVDGMRRRCEKWHVFVFIADRDHVIFRYTPEHTGPAVQAMLNGFCGHLLADAAGIYDILFRDYGMTEVSCWFHLRRYFWRAIDADRERAFEALSLIAKLFEIERECKAIPMPERTQRRASQAGPVLDLFEKWLARHRGTADPRGPLAAAITYYDNQRVGLRRFLEDGRLRMDNNISENELRKLVLGRLNWTFFENETGLDWYTTFRSLIASCWLHQLNPQLYLEQVLRLAPHWPVNRVLELSPKYWAATLAALDARQRAIIAPPWEAARLDIAPLVVAAA